MNLLAQIISFIGIISNIIGIQLKNKKDILISFIIANLSFGISFVLLKSYSGAAISFIAATQAIINFFIDKKGKTVSKYLITTYIIISTLVGLITYRTIIDIMPIICSVLFTLSIIQKKEKKVRIYTLTNITLWTIYDLIVGVYTAGISNIFLISSTIISIVRYDILKVNKNKI